MALSEQPRRSSRKSVQKNWEQLGYSNEFKTFTHEALRKAPKSPNVTTAPKRSPDVLGAPVIRTNITNVIAQNGRPDVGHSKQKSNLISFTRSNNRRVLVVALDCFICGHSTPDRDTMAEHLRTEHGRERYNCLALGCDASFDREGILGAHVRKAHPEMIGNWPCGDCSGLYRTHNLLYKHIWDLHAKGQFACGYPGCSFGPVDTRNLIRQHYVHEHDADKYSCQFCSRPFNSATSLRHHERTHTGERPFRCTWPGCGHMSVVKCSLVTHIRSCHFKCARTLKKQIEKDGKLDERDVNDWIDVVEDDVSAVENFEEDEADIQEESEEEENKYDINESEEVEPNTTSPGTELPEAISKSEKAGASSPPPVVHQVTLYKRRYAVLRSVDQFFNNTTVKKAKCDSTK